jgi:molybdopterin-guanine dinucleotide biosynthesis protein A
MPIEFLSFPVQSGKTSWLDAKFGHRKDVFGFLTPGDPAHRVLRLLPTREEHPYAAAPGIPAIEIGRFRLDKRAFDHGLRQLHTGLNSPECRILIVDEIGPIEVRQRIGFAPGIDDFIAAARQRSDVTTYLVVRDYLLPEARIRWQLTKEPANRPEWFEKRPEPIGVVLAGGESRRMGRDKAFIERGGTPAYANAATLLAPHCSHVVVSGNGNYPPYAGMPDDPRFAGCGPLSGVLTAAQHHPGSPLFVLGVDYPHLKPEALERLKVAATLTGKSTCYRQVGGGKGDVEPLVALYSATDLAALEPWFASGRESLRKFLAACSGCELPHDPRIGLVSVDERRDLA